MRKSRFTAAADNRFPEAGEAGSASRRSAGRAFSASPRSTKWRAKYGGMDAEEAMRLKELEVENARLKKLMAEAHLDLESLKIGFGVKR